MEMRGRLRLSLGMFLAELAVFSTGVCLAAFAFADITPTAAAAGAGFIPAFISNTFVLWALKFVGIGGLLKMALSLKVAGKEVIDWLPVTFNLLGFAIPVQSLYPHAVTLLCYVAYNLLTGGYATEFWPVFEQNLIAAGITGSTANTIHNWWTAYQEAKTA